MNVTVEKPREQYLAACTALNANGASASLKAIREQAVRDFQALEFPHTRMEEWRHTNIAPIVDTPYEPLTSAPAHGLTKADVAPFLFQEAGWTELVLVDGYFDAALSELGPLPKGAHAGGLADAIAAGNSVLASHLNRQLKPRNAYTALNTALLQDGFFVYVPANTVLEHPIHVLCLTSRRAPKTVANPRHLAVLGTSAEAQLLVSYASLADETPYLTNAVTELALGANAGLRYHKMVAEGAQGNHLDTLEVSQDRDSRFGAIGITLEGAIVRNQICCRLEGEGAACNLDGVFLNDGKRLIDNALDVTHAAPNCSSRMFYKGILDGQSKAAFTGKVLVEREAQQTDSNQLCSSLMLSDTATVDAKPQLEIYADDVKCTHGATVGPAPEEIIFYFRSRGIAEEEARGMMTYGFADEISGEIEIPALRKRIDAYLFEKYSPKKRALV